MFTDTHAHLDLYSDEFKIDQIIQEANIKGINIIISVGDGLDSCLRNIYLAEKYKNIYTAVGVHPHNAKYLNWKVLNRLAEFCQHKKVIAVGETGLDFYRNHSPHNQQEQAFRLHLELALVQNLPVIIHNREAHQTTMKILRKFKGQGVLHCFSGDLKMAFELVDRGFYISFAGPLTFLNAEKTREIARNIPLERILLETDSPYLAPHPLRGQQNYPANVILIAEKLAELFGLNLEEVAQITSDNASRLFNLKIISSEGKKQSYDCQ